MENKEISWNGQEKRQRRVPPNSLPRYLTLLSERPFKAGFMDSVISSVFPKPPPVCSRMSESPSLIENKHFYFTVRDTRLRTKMSGWCKTKTKINSHYTVVRQSVSKEKGNRRLSEAFIVFGRGKGLRNTWGGGRCSWKRAGLERIAEGRLEVAEITTSRFTVPVQGR